MRDSRGSNVQRANSVLHSLMSHEIKLYKLLWDQCQPECAQHTPSDLNSALHECKEPYQSRFLNLEAPCNKTFILSTFVKLKAQRSNVARHVFLDGPRRLNGLSNILKEQKRNEKTTSSVCIQGLGKIPGF